MSNALTMTGRSLRLSARSPEALLTALLLPVMLMLVFVYLFGGAVSIGTAYVDYVVPGVSCSHCVRAISDEVATVAGVTRVSVDLGTKVVAVTGSALDDAAVRSAIAEAGYQALP